MLNISKNKLNDKVTLEGYRVFDKVFKARHNYLFNRFLYGSAIVLLIILFLPWTQNVTGNGFITTLKPGQRPQTIQSPIPGKIEKWHVQEGDFVKKGDTILFISEIKNEYQDPRLLERTLMQRDAKNRSVGSYKEKIKALEYQIKALRQERVLKEKQTRNKLEQAQLKVESNTIDVEAVQANYEIAQRQYDRTLTLQTEGLKSVTDVETKRLKLQEMKAKVISQENKLLASKNEVINATMEINRITAEYTNKIAKAQSDKFTAASVQFDTEAQVSKLDNQSTNYELRNALHYITAPQDGYINKALLSGLGETFKEGEKLVNIMPSNYDLAVETYVKPLDIPLIHIGEEVRIQFDGWPAIFFSGWPNASYGTYAGKVVAIETFISTNGKFRVLIAPDEKEYPWPENIRVGSGAYTISLLEDVPIWYELWRLLNGFPPNYYTPKDTGKTASKKSKS